MEYKTPLVIIFFQTVHRMIGRPAIVIFLLGLSFSGEVFATMYSLIS